MRDLDKIPIGTVVFGEPEQGEVGIDQNGKPQWYLNVDGGWHEVGERTFGESVIILSACDFKPGTHITIKEPVEPNLERYEGPKVWP